jgi:hypothetical protein
VEHCAEHDLIVNTAQMRDAAILDNFRHTPSALVTIDVIKKAAEKAFAERQQKKKKAIQEEVVDDEPLRKKTRTTTTRISSSTTATGPGPSNVVYEHQPGAEPSGLRFSNTYQSSFNY